MNHAYIKSWNKKKKMYAQNHILILGSSSFLVFITKDLLFYSLWSPSLSNEWAPFWFQWECFWGGRTIKGNSFLSFFSILHKNSLFSLFSFFFLCHQMTIFQRLVIWREKILISLLGSYEKLVDLKSFNELEEGPNESI